METAQEELLEEKVDLRILSGRLKAASRSLRKVINDTPLALKEKENLEWTGSLISKVYWDSHFHIQSTIPEPVAQEVRLEFYDLLLDLHKNKTTPDYVSKEFFDQLCLTLSAKSYQSAPKTVIVTAERFMTLWSEEIRQKENYYYFCHPKPKIV